MQTASHDAAATSLDFLKGDEERKGPRIYLSHLSASRNTALHYMSEQNVCLEERRIEKSLMSTCNRISGFPLLLQSLNIARAGKADAKAVYFLPRYKMGKNAPGVPRRMKKR